MELKSTVTLRHTKDFPPGPFAEKEVSAILEAILITIDVPFRKSEPVPKSILIDFFGTQKSGKTKITEKIEQLFRRHEFNVFCPPETAEIKEVRNKLTESPIVSQFVHLTGVQDYVLNLAQHPRFHLTIISRGLIDMLYWYEKGLRENTYSSLHVESVKNQIYEFLKLDLVDIFFFFTCSVETAMKREYEESLTQRRGSKMNEKDIAETMDIYESVLERVNTNVPGLPIYHIDTSELNVKQVGEEVLKLLLPTVCSRFKVPLKIFMPYSISLVQKHASQSPYFEEQIKLAGHPVVKRIEKADWFLVKEFKQEDIYLNLNPDDPQTGFSSEILRIRKEEDGFWFMYKGVHRDRMFSHRYPFTLEIDSSEAKKILDTYKVITVLKKNRRYFQNKDYSGKCLFTLHIDSVEGLGDFTEIRARGTSGKTHTEELLALTEELGFRPSSIVEGNYLSMVLNKKTS